MICTFFGHRKCSEKIEPALRLTIEDLINNNKRNAWMINESDFVVTYVRYSTGGAAHFKELAEKKGKIVINL